MKVNVYDQENIQKGRMMLLNIAEDLKEDCKMTVSPIKEDGKKEDDVSGDKPQDFDEMKRAAEAQKEQKDSFMTLDVEDVSDGEEEDFEQKAQYLYMELKSTASFKDVDIDSMLEHTTFDDFMRGLYLNKVQSTSKTGPAAGANPFDAMMKQVMSGEEERGPDIKLDFQDAEEEGAQEKNLEQQALDAVRARRKRGDTGIFDGSEKKLTIREKQILEEKLARENEEREYQQELLRELDIDIDISKIQQEQKLERQILEDYNELDILDEYIHPLDLKGRNQQAKLREEIDEEKMSIKVKYLFRYGRQEDDPFKLWS